MTADWPDEPLRRRRVQGGYQPEGGGPRPPLPTTGSGAKPPPRDQEDEARFIAQLAAQIGPRRYYDVGADRWEVTDEGYAVRKARKYLIEARKLVNGDEP